MKAYNTSVHEKNTEIYTAQISIRKIDENSYQ